VHVLLGALTERKTRRLEQATTTKLTKLLHTIQTFSTDKKHDQPKHLPSKFTRKPENELCEGTELSRKSWMKCYKTFTNKQK
jgi:hypothetical protein